MLCWICVFSKCSEQLTVWPIHERKTLACLGCLRSIFLKQKAANQEYVRASAQPRFLSDSSCGLSSDGGFVSWMKTNPESLLEWKPLNSRIMTRYLTNSTMKFRSMICAPQSEVLYSPADNHTATSVNQLVGLVAVHFRFRCFILRRIEHTSLPAGMRQWVQQAWRWWWYLQQNLGNS